MTTKNKSPRAANAGAFREGPQFTAPTNHSISRNPMASYPKPAPGCQWLMPAQCEEVRREINRVVLGMGDENLKAELIGDPYYQMPGRQDTLLQVSVGLYRYLVIIYDWQPRLNINAQGLFKRTFDILQTTLIPEDVADDLTTYRDARELLLGNGRLTARKLLLASSAEASMGCFDLMERCNPAHWLTPIPLSASIDCIAYKLLPEEKGSR